MDEIERRMSASTFAEWAEFIADTERRKALALDDPSEEG